MIKSSRELKAGGPIFIRMESIGWGAMGAALFKAGGLTLTIHTSGMAYTKKEWNELIEDQEYIAISI